MSNASVPSPRNEREVARAWSAALRQAVALRAAQRYESRLLVGPGVRSVAIELCPLIAAPNGLESPVTLRAIATLVTLAHPVTLALMLAGVLDAPAGQREKKPPQRGGAEAEAWLRRQLGTLEVKK